MRFWPFRLEQKCSHATDAVPRHFRLASIRVEETNAGVVSLHLRFHDDDKAVAANPGVTFKNSPCEIREAARNVALPGYDKVVPQSVIFCERNLKSFAHIGFEGRAAPPASGPNAARPCEAVEFTASGVYKS